MNKLNIGDEVTFTYNKFMYYGVIVEINNEIYKCRVDKCLTVSNYKIIPITDYANVVYWYGGIDEFDIVALSNYGN